MAIKPEDEFVGKINSADANYPQGSARDVSSPGDGTGTPWKASLINDIWGFLQTLLARAGITPNGSPDTSLISQYWDSLNRLFGIGLKKYDTIDGAIADAANLIIGDRLLFEERSAGEGGGSDWKVIAKTAENGRDIVETPLNTSISLRLIIKNYNLDVDQWGASSAASSEIIQAVMDYSETVGGPDVLLNPEKTYGVDTNIGIGASGTEVILRGTGRKNGATLNALSDFTGGLLIISQGGFKNLSFTGFNKDTVGHVAFTLGTALVTNPLVTCMDGLNNGGFYDFGKTIFEYDRARLIRLTSEVEVGHSVLDLQTGGSFAHAAEPIIESCSFRNPDITRSVGEAKKFGIIIKRSESAKISGVISNFDNSIVLNNENREPDLSNLVVLDLRSTPSNDLWESEWVTAIGYLVGNKRRPTRLNVNGHFYECTTAITSSGVTEPIWPITFNGTVADGDGFWTQVGESVNITIGIEQQVKLSTVRSENAIVALKNISNSNIEVSSSRFVGEDAAILNVSGSNSAMQMDNCLVSGDFFLTPTGGGGVIAFKGNLNNIVSDTILSVPSHKGHGGETGSFTNTDHAFAAGNGIDFLGFTKVGSGATQKFERYEDDNNTTAWIPAVTAQTNTSIPVITSAYYTIYGNRVECGIRGTVTVSADNLESSFRLTAPIPMHSATLSDVSGSLDLITANGDTAKCSAQSNSNGNNTDIAFVMPKKSIANAGDSGVGLVFFGTIRYKIL